MNFNPQVTDYIAQAPDGQIELLESLRALVHESVNGTTEAIKWGFPVFGKIKDFAYLRHSKKHVTLGFYNIDKIDDPDNLLEGSGNTLRHIKVKSTADIDEKLLTKWLHAIAY